MGHRRHAAALGPGGAGGLPRRRGRGDGGPAVPGGGVDALVAAPGEVWIVGDTARDLACARAVGVRCALVATGRTPVGELAGLGADIVLPDLSDPRPLLDRRRL